MHDKAWQAVHRAVVPRLTATDIVLAPQGRWDPFPCPVRLYRSTLALADESVVILHKGRLAGMHKADLADLMLGWSCLYASAVFLVFSRAPRPWALIRLGPAVRHLLPVLHHLRSRAARRLPATIWYAHLPKTGGTSVWTALARLFPSHIYYGEGEALEAYPPRPGDYDLVGFHAPPARVLPLLREGDTLAGLVRDPDQRVWSSVLHSRRAGEDPDTLQPAQRAMRAQTVSDFLRSPEGQHEATLQVAELGAGAGSEDGAARLQAALQLVRRPDALFAPTPQAQAFLDTLLARYGRYAPRLERRNAAEPEAYLREEAEFMAAKPLLAAMNGVERVLYDAVTARFMP